jgi:hypothetical protein
VLIKVNYYKMHGINNVKIAISPVHYLADRRAAGTILNNKTNIPLHWIIPREQKNLANYFL